MSTEAMKLALEALEAVSMEMTVGERYTNAGQQVLDAIDLLRVALSQQPATGEPVGYMNEGHIHELAMGRIPYGYVYPEAGAGASTAVYARPAPSVLKDDQIAALVNKVRDIARMFNDHQSLRERIAIELVPALKVTQEVKSDAERGRFLIEWLERYGLLQAEFGQMGVGEKPENWWLLHAPWGIDQTRPFLGHGKTPEQAIDAAMSHSLTVATTTRTKRRP